MNVICKLAFGTRVNNFGKGSTETEQRVAEMVHFAFYYFSPAKRFERMSSILRKFSPWSEVRSIATGCLCHSNSAILAQWGKFKSTLIELRNFLDGMLSKRENILAETPGELPEYISCQSRQLLP
jgi:hypothetical protein